MIVDDEINAVEVLKLLVQQSGLLQLAHATTQPLDALDFVNKNPVDIAFLDINMPGMNGLELARALRGKCKVVFTTAYSEFVSDAFDLEVVDYLLKPIPLSRFIKAAHRAIDSLTPAPPLVMDINAFSHDYFFVRTEQKGKMQKIDLSDIDYVEGMKNYVAIHHLGLKTMALLTMKEIEERLPPAFFARVQRSFIVAIHKIALIEGNIIRLKNSDVEIAIGDVYKAQLMEAMKSRLL
jgi:two-component system, LytTR family, response regulator